MSVYIVFVSFIDTMAQLPILSPFVVSLGAGAVFTGVILGSYSLVNMVGNVLVGPLIDLHGRRAGIIAGLLLAGTAVALYAVAAGPRRLLLLRMLHGAGGAVLIPAVFAQAGDMARPGAVGPTMGRVGAAIALAAMVGPALGGWGATVIGPRGVFLFLGGLLLLTAGGLMLRKPVTGLSMPLKVPAHGSYIARILHALRDPALAGTYASTFGLNFAMGTLAYSFPLGMRALGYGSAHTGSFFGLYAFCVLLTLLLPSNRLGEQIGFARTAMFGASAVALALSLLAFVTAPVLIGISMVVYGVGFGLMFPAICSAVVVNGEPSRRGAAFGAFSAVYSLGLTVGPISAGFLSREGLSPYLGAVAVVLLTQVLQYRFRLKTAGYSEHR